MGTTLITGETTMKKKGINQTLQDKLIHESKMKSDKHSTALLNDDRFKKLFDNPDFEVDEECNDFKLRNPSSNHNKMNSNNKKKVDNNDGEDFDSDASNYSNNHDDNIYGFTKVKSQENDHDEESSPSD